MAELDGGGRPKVVVRTGGFEFRSSIARMGGEYWLGVSAERRTAEHVSTFLREMLAADPHVSAGLTPAQVDVGAEVGLPRPAGVGEAAAVVGAFSGVAGDDVDVDVEGEDESVRGSGPVTDTGVDAGDLGDDDLARTQSLPQGGPMTTTGGPSYMKSG